MPVERIAGGTNFVDDDSLVQDTIENIEEICAAGYPFNGHRSFRQGPCRARGRECRRCCCLRTLIPSVGAREKLRCRATLVPEPVRSNIGPLNSVVAKHLPIQPLQAEHLMENGFCPQFDPG